VTAEKNGRLFVSFLKLGLTAFGGPAMVAYIKEMAVSRHKWLDEETFKNGVVLSQTVPGATAMQTAAYVGLKVNGVSGALAAYIGFGLPAFILMLMFSILYTKYHSIPVIASLFSGLQVVVTALVVNATYTFGRSTFKGYKEVLVAAAAFGLFQAGLSPFAVIVIAAVAGLVFMRGPAMTSPLPGKDIHWFKPIAGLLLFVCAGLVVLYLFDRRVFSLAALMMRIDLFAFGGGFGSLPLMLHEIVSVRGWMDSKTFMDGIALGQVTPGPIVITSTFVGYLLYGWSGAIVATIAIFTPSFLMIVALAPVFDRLKSSAYFTGATKGILASFVGLLFFVSLKFALAVPWDGIRVLLALAAFTALLKKVDVVYVVLIAAIISVIIFR
jgi:chromate transporter